MPQAPHPRLVCEKSGSHHLPSKPQSSWILHLLPPPQGHSAPAWPAEVCGEWGGWLGAFGSNAVLEWELQARTRNTAISFFFSFFIIAILKGVKWYPFPWGLLKLSIFSCASRGSSQPRYWTQVSQALQVGSFVCLGIKYLIMVQEIFLPFHVPTCLLRKKILRRIFCSLKKKKKFLHVELFEFFVYFGY